MNALVGGLVDTSRRFQAAWAAFIQPARKPTRRSGTGAAGFRAGFCADTARVTSANNASTARVNGCVATRSLSDRARGDERTAGPIERQRGARPATSHYEIVDTAIRLVHISATPALPMDSLSRKRRRARAVCSFVQLPYDRRTGGYSMRRFTPLLALLGL